MVVDAVHRLWSNAGKDRPVCYRGDITGCHQRATDEEKHVAGQPSVRVCSV